MAATGRGLGERRLFPLYGLREIFLKFFPTETTGKIFGLEHLYGVKLSSSKLLGEFQLNLIEMFLGLSFSKMVCDVSRCIMGLLRQQPFNNHIITFLGSCPRTPIPFIGEGARATSFSREIYIIFERG